MRKSTLLASIAGVIAVTIAASGTPASSAESKEFGNNDLRGSWGFIGTGATGPLGILEDQATHAVVGRMTFDGEGNGTTQIYHNNMAGGPGMVPERNFTYQVYPDGTGTISGMGSAEYRFVIVDNKKELFLLRYNEGNVQARIAKRQ